MALLVVLAGLALAGCGDGGEKSIDSLDSEGGKAERTAVTSAFRGYLGALASRDFAAVCANLASPVRASVAQLAARSSNEPCSITLPRLLAPTAAAVARSQANGRVTRVRINGDRAFVVFQAPGAELYQLPLVREGGDWTAALLAASTLVPSAADLGRRGKDRRTS
jgi:hypothetical protein